MIKNKELEKLHKFPSLLIYYIIEIKSLYPMLWWCIIVYLFVSIEFSLSVLISIFLFPFIGYLIDLFIFTKYTKNKKEVISYIYKLEPKNT